MNWHAFFGVLGFFAGLFGIATSLTWGFNVIARKWGFDAAMISLCAAFLLLVATFVGLGSHHP